MSCGGGGSEMEREKEGRKTTVERKPDLHSFPTRREKIEIKPVGRYVAVCFPSPSLSIASV